MEKLSFRVDDPEILDFVYSLGRERSKIICQLLRDCMEEGDGYVPTRVMAATGFSYKNKKSIKKTGTVTNSKPKQSPKRQKPLYKEEPVVAPAPAPLEEQKEVISKEPETVKEPELVKEPEPVRNEQSTTGDEESYVSSAPKIQNAGLVMAQLSAFGGV